jgi:hypothetical protein
MELNTLLDVADLNTGIYRSFGKDININRKFSERAKQFKVTFLNPK